MNDAFGTSRRRIIVVDGLTGIALALVAVLEVLADPPDGSAWLYVPGAAICGLSLCLRRSFPDWCVVLAISPVAVGALFEAGLVTSLTPFVVSMVAMASMALHAAHPVRSPALLVAAVGVVVVASRSDWPEDIFYFALQFALAWAAGYAVRLQVARVARVSAEAARRETELELEVQTAISQERARMAREIHDIVGHGISLMVVHAGAAEQHADEPATVRSSMAAIQDVGRQAVTDMARLLNVLRSDHAEIGLGPQPGVGDIATLCDATRDAGTPISFEGDVGVDDVPATVGLTAYRVVQEALTNAIRHAPGAPVDVRVWHAADTLRLRIVNGPAPGGARQVPAHGTGHGLQGLSERVRLFGGSLRAEPSDAGFEVEARIPLHGAVAPAQ